MATHSSIFAWEIPWTEEPGGHGHKELDTTRCVHTTQTHIHQNDSLNFSKLHICSI